MERTVVAIFNYRCQASCAMELLKSNGFNSSDVVIMDGKKCHNEPGEESGLWYFLKNFFISNYSRTERWLNMAQRAFIVNLITYSKKDALAAAGILDDCGAVDTEEDYHKFFYGKEYRDDSDYEKESMLNELKPSYRIAENHYATSEKMPGYYREDKDFETDYKRFSNEYGESFENLKGNEVANGYKVAVNSSAARMRSLIIETPTNALRFLEGQLKKRLKLV